MDIGGKIASLNPASKALLGLGEGSRGAFLATLPSEIGWALTLAITGSWQPRDVEVAIDHDSHGVLHMILSTAVLHAHDGQPAGHRPAGTRSATAKGVKRNPPQ